MRQKAKILFACLMLIPALAFSTAPVAVAAFNPLGEACKGQAANSPACQQAKTQGTTDPIAGPYGVINKAANIIALITGIGAVIMILIGGFFYVTAGGNAENAAKAKARILSALIGLVVVALAWTIVRLITDRVLR